MPESRQKFISKQGLIDRWCLLEDRTPQEANRFIRTLRETGRIEYIHLSHTTVRYLMESVLRLESEGLDMRRPNGSLRKDERTQSRSKVKARNR
jgi:hypothetical protein